MVIVTVKYIKPLEVIDALLADHRKFLDECYKAGKFICSGPRNPRIGGVILANLNLAEAQAVVQGDPFYTNQAAAYEFIEFTPLKYDERFACFVGK